MTIAPEQAAWFAETFSLIADNVEQAVLGKRHVVELVLATAVSGGHVLLEDAPGTGKTALARAIAETVHGTSSRVQFTPDLLPGDITGITVYDQKAGRFEFHAGPVFANVVLADEINRASPKTQSALLEVMEEGNVTIDGVTRPVGNPFLVIATQNPIEQGGTYRLPEAQLDRFSIKTSIGYPDEASTMRILQAVGAPKPKLEAIVGTDTIVAMTELSRGVYVNPIVSDYIMRIVDATRRASEVRLGVSVRGAIALSKLAMAWAAAAGRTYATPDDVRSLAVAALAHRLVLEPEAEFDGVTSVAVINQILLDVLAPRENGVA
ncbi:MoxR family ATPase [Agromyces sp. Leaf222]|uniref:AAA family ATPase n=1 Tax=Agromyces sp. Leaf222 TaxID=1735688 RepID=UPI0006FAAB90|nr:MoxR family ATPase [Agromyces sp. Leaf222]KQM82140.1 ATPase [Agromyces sp. Leaf222]